MTAIQMPKFNLKKAEVSDEDFAKVGEFENKYLDPGEHDVKITAIENKGPPDNNPTWIRIKVTYTGANGLTANEFLSAPTSTFKYVTKSGKGELIPAKRLQAFFKALGEDLQPSTSTELLTKYIGNNKMIGKELSIVIGYEGPHAKFMEKGVYHLVDKDDQPYRDSDGQVPIFSSRDEVKAYCKQHALPYAEYSRVLKYIPSETQTSEDSDAEDTASW